jgi:glycosyltransferase involved in cell wall biosynthesis
MLIDADRGVNVQLGSTEQLTERFARELEALVSDPARIMRLGLAARDHAMRRYTWDAKALKLMEVYRWAAGLGPRPPSDLI